MRVVIQRVEKASVKVENKLISSISNGLLILLGIEDADNIDDIDWLSSKILKLRIFDDEDGVMNKSVADIEGEIIVVSQFTLHAATKKGNRPSYARASKSEFAEKMYKNFVQQLKEKSRLNVYTGSFGAMMKVELINDGPVTIIVDTKQKDF